MQFVCRLGTPDGRVVEEVHDGASLPAMRTALESTGYHVFEIKPASVAARFNLPKLRSRIPSRALMIFNQELASLLGAGLPLLEGLGMLASRQRNAEFQKILAEVRDRVEGGESLAAAVASFGDKFPPLYAASLEAGEQSGELVSVLRRYVRHQKLLLEARKKTTSAMVYPAVLVLLSLALVALMILVVIPSFEQFYAGFEGAELPALTRMVVGVSTAARNHWLIWVPALAISLFVGYSMLGTEAGRRWWDRQKLRLPIVGKVLKLVSLSEFCRALGTLLSAGLALVPSLDTSIRSVGNAWVRNRIRPLSGEVNEGAALYEAMEGTGEFDELAIDMVQVGESSGELANMLTTVSDFFDEEAETRMERALSLLEPVLLVFMGVVIATLLAAVYLPLISIVGQVN